MELNVNTIHHQMCGFSSAVLWAHKCGLYKPGFYKSSVHVIEECTVHAGGVASIALQKAVLCTVCMWQRDSIDIQVFLHWIRVFHVLIMLQFISPQLYLSSVSRVNTKIHKIPGLFSLIPVDSCEFTYIDHVQCISLTGLSQMNTHSINLFLKLRIFSADKPV